MDYTRIMDYKEKRHSDEGLNDGDLATIGDILISSIK
jgi:hypothetical protein